MKFYWIDVIDEFLIEKSWNEGLSPRTIETYTSTFNLLQTCNYIDATNLETFTELNFKKFLLESLNKYRWSSYTYNQRRKNLKIFCDYLIKRNLLEENPFKNISVRKEEKPLPKYLNSKQVSELLEVIESEFMTTDFLNIRNKTIFYSFLFTWLRLSELTNLRVQDVNFLDYQISVFKWKWNKDRQIPLIDMLSTKLLSYLNLHKRYFGKNKCDLLFPTKNGYILRKRDMHYLFWKVQRKISFKLTPHMLRHTFATELVRKDINLFKISRILGHSNTKTTQIYLGLDTRDLRNDLNTKSLFIC